MALSPERASVKQLSAAVDDDSARRIVRRQRHRNLIAEHDTDAVLAQLAPEVSQHLVSIFELDTKVAGGQHFDHAALKLYVFFSSHRGSRGYSLDCRRSNREFSLFELLDTLPST